ncbi:MAG: GNAT family N-acetyltransferase [Phototrophicaceae bacterium]
MIIRDAVAQDVDAIASVHVASWQTTYTGIMPDEAIAARSFEVRQRQWQRSIANDNQIILVAEQNDKIVGFANGGKPQADSNSYDCELYAIYLLKEAQQQGIGSALIRSLAKRLYASGYKSMILSVLENNAGSSQFYANLGGVIVGTGTYQATNNIALNIIHYGWQNIQSLFSED